MTIATCLFVSSGWDISFSMLNWTQDDFHDIVSTPFDTKVVNGYWVTIAKCFVLLTTVTKYKLRNTFYSFCRLASQVFNMQRWPKEWARLPCESWKYRTSFLKKKLREKLVSKLETTNASLIRITLLRFLFFSDLRSPFHLSSAFFLPLLALSFTLSFYCLSLCQSFLYLRCWVLASLKSCQVSLLI